MIHPHNNYQMQQINVSQPPPQHIQQQQNPQSNSQRMNHHHYQQRLNHQQIQQQLPPPQIHGTGNRNLNGHNQHQVPIVPKQHLHQNIATLNQKPPQHLNNQPHQNSQIQPSSITQRLSYEKSSIQSNNNLKRESSSISVPQSAATATLSSNNSSIITVPTPSHITVQPTSHHHHHQNPLLPKYSQQQQTHHQIIDTSKTDSKTPIVSANKENIPASVNVSVISSQSSVLSNISLESKLNAENTEQGIESLANAKEKTPMCLVNELARFNKIQHQYRLISEQGPAHKKRFTVILKLGEEEYAAEGLSIKKAQHAAAKDAIMKTTYKHPPLKINRQIKGIQANGKGNSGNITPTVELNALAMKRGEPTIYTIVSSTVNPTTTSNNMQFSQPLQQPSQPSQYNARGNPFQRRFGNQRGAGNLPSNRFNSGSSCYGATEVFHVTLQVGNRNFAGMGPTQQAARHDAAARALEVLKPLTMENEGSKNSSANTSFGDHESASGDESLINSDIKSPISIVHEMALKRKLTVAFEVQSEKGPPHMKVYTTLCKVGTFVTEGEGNGKKLSKKKAAEKMMDELKKLPPPSPVEEPQLNRGNTKGRRKQQQQQQQLQQPQQSVVVKKKSRNLIKEKLEQSNSDEINPISQLIQIQQARKEKEPTYTVIDERGTARRREFVIEVAAGGMTASGTGPNKKIAKRIAAENLLVAMGIAKPSISSLETTKERKSDIEKNKKVSFVESESKKSAKCVSTPNSGGRQIVPGLLLVNSSTESFTPTKTDSPLIKENSDHQTAEKSPSPNSNNSGSNDSGIGDHGGGVSPRDQLSYLATLIGFSVSYSDFPKANHTEFLSLVTLSTDPPHMSHGSGTTVDESRDHAALKALGVLSELGIDNVKPKGSSK